MSAQPFARPDVSVLTGASQTHALPANRWEVWQRRIAHLRIVGRRARVVTIRRADAALSVTTKALGAYALTVGALACFVVAGFVVTPALGWAVAGAGGLWFNHGLQRQE